MPYILTKKIAKTRAGIAREKTIAAFAIARTEAQGITFRAESRPRGIPNTKSKRCSCKGHEERIKGGGNDYV